MAVFAAAEQDFWGEGDDAAVAVEADDGADSEALLQPQRCVSVGVGGRAIWNSTLAMLRNESSSGATTHDCCSWRRACSQLDGQAHQSGLPRGMVLQTLPAQLPAQCHVKPVMSCPSHWRKG